ncbi:Hypothetical protein FKW44_021938 [Caligus rogercresseyi]|uniref:Uncharacterized protein n=1 Tax=Caligus rogercresseyi TaxID=217165 RepID=A0A7T8JVH5_CALRO|nr:Hypothetical protein FKW44_021938 [Caligus rogercresseyi]
MTGFYLEKRKTSPMQLRTLFRRQKPPQSWSGAGVTSDGNKAPIIFVEEGAKIDRRYTCIFFQRRCPRVQKSILRLFYCSNKMAPIPYQQIGSKLLH